MDKKQFKKYIKKYKKIAKSEFQKLKKLEFTVINGIFIVVVVGLVLVLFLIYLFNFGPAKGNDRRLDDNRPQYPDVVNLLDDNTCENQRSLDGMCTGSDENHLSETVAVIVENHSVARPTSGLERAQLVYEAPVEGGITRFLMLFQTDNIENVDRIGPVRSARPYFVEWVKPYNALFAHVGGSPAGLDKIKSENIKDFDEYFRGSYFRRVSERLAPHNTFISLENLYKGAWDIYSEQESIYEQWLYKDDEPNEERGLDAQTIDVTYSSSLYNVMWEYSQDKNGYFRYNGSGRIDVGEDGYKNILVMYTDISVIDEVGRLDIRTIGNGKAEIFRDGQRIQGTWQKDSINDFMKFYDLNGKEVFLNRGRSWIHVLDKTGTPVKYSEAENN